MFNEHGIDGKKKWTKYSGISAKVTLDGIIKALVTASLEKDIRFHLGLLIDRLFHRFNVGKTNNKTSTIQPFSNVA